MNINDFFEKLEENNIKFHFTSDRIRSVGEACPICALCFVMKSKFFDNEDFDLAGKELGLEYTLSCLIADSSDYIYMESAICKEIRLKLIKLCQ